MIADWTLVVAISANGVIGDGNDLPWRLSSDLKRFKKMTMGHCLLMGRKTYESIGRPLPGRQTIVLSRNPTWSPGHDAVQVVAGLDQVADRVEPGRKVMVVGGAQVYQSAIALCQTMWVTRVLTEVRGDTSLAIEWDDWRLDSSEHYAAGDKDDYATEFQVWSRR